MFPPSKHLCLTFEPDSQAQSETQGPAEAHVVTAEEEEETSSSCSFNFSYPSTSPASSPGALASQKGEEEKGQEKEPAATLSPPQSLEGSCSVPALRSTSEGGSSSPEKEDPGSLQASADIESSPKDPLDEQVADLARFMILKYQSKDFITEAEMVNVITKKYRKHFPVIFTRASKCLEVICGIDVKEVDPTVHGYVLVSSLDLADDEVSTEKHRMPTNGFLAIILGVIFLEGNCISEENLWDFLNIMGVYAGKEHFIYGEPRKLITVDWVRDSYLESRQVPNSDPPRYEFRWGLRAYAETTKVKVLEFLVKIKGMDPISFSLWYEKALRDDEEGDWTGIGFEESTAAMSVPQQ
ncbi:melanoma-associated antigen 10-like [Crocuta crocuta]